jgi:Holliday junction resolvase-like predicted endonuclease
MSDSAAAPSALAAADAKRQEKLLKKAKLFIDEKQKTKTRLASLYAFLGELKFPF